MPESTFKERRRGRRGAVRRLTQIQRSILQELRPVQRKMLSTASFQPRVRPVSTDVSVGGQGWSAPGPPVAAQISGSRRQTIVFTGPSGQRIRRGEEPIKSVLRHEIGHQLLAARRIPSGVHHAIQEARGTVAGTRQLGTITAVQSLKQRVRKQGRLPRKTFTSELARPLPAGAPRTGGFSTAQLHLAERTGTMPQRVKARRLQERLGRRARKRGVDF